ncbi:uncharacterized protein LACBIDRAFT_314376 [Laccaria bicolor S238N-H82]|uniref:Predicted protein n=2 Tax=Laccaria bicolor (strain S238N-H82 / ATCC MYA-4686) TaxID=486041 RepID=B0DYE9_LACBS|nr:uncharacterized protein LACBIDRAFT_314376 [Laccaria bicolor S238N-H82]EDR00422.1 predicted protein [Laccaria bicolor S238N-H82]|eukprot:XP_001888981.1 predicted protein [Laccaria bicolor S238N-H82]
MCEMGGPRAIAGKPWSRSGQKMWILGPTAGGQSGQKVTKFETAQSQSPDKIDEMSKKKPPSRYLGIIVGHL